MYVCMYVGETHFHMKGFERRLVLTSRLEWATRNNIFTGLTRVCETRSIHLPVLGFTSLHRLKVALTMAA